MLFDSGVGGLSIAAALRRLSPAAPMAYLADQGGFPYGDLDDAALIRRLLRLIGAAVDAIRPAAIVVACNTASTVALPALRAAFDIPFIGCVPPIKPAAACSITRRIGVLATPATVRRDYIQALISRFAADCRVFSHGSPRLAPLAEAAFRGDPVPIESIAAEIMPLLAQSPAIDTIVLGCTHYAFLLPRLRQIAPDIRFWLDPAEPVARQALDVLAQHPNPPPQTRSMAFTTARLDPRTEAGIQAYGFGTPIMFHPQDRP